MYVVFDIKIGHVCVLQSSVRCTQAVRRKSEAVTEARRSCRSVRLLCQTRLQSVSIVGVVHTQNRLLRRFNDLEELGLTRGIARLTETF